MKLVIVTSLFLTMVTALPTEGKKDWSYLFASISSAQERQTDVGFLAEMTVNREAASCGEDCVDKYCMDLGNIDYVACMLSKYKKLGSPQCPFDVVVIFEADWFFTGCQTMCS